MDHFALGHVPTPSRFLLGLGLSLAFLASGCAGLVDTKKTLYTGAEGTVALEEIVDWSFEASHPSSIDSALLMRVLQGVRVGSGEGATAYTAREIEFLAPLLSTALSKAKPEHVVSFHVSEGSSTSSGITGGTLYVKGPAVYLTPIPSHAPKTGGNQDGVVFEPRSVSRTQKATPDVAQGQAYLTTLIVDHWTLAKLPAPAPAVAIAQAPAAPMEASHVPAPLAAMPPKVVAPSAPSVAPKTAARPMPKIGGEKPKPVVASKAKPTAPAKAVAKAVEHQKPAVSEHKAILELLKKPAEVVAPAPAN